MKGACLDGFVSFLAPAPMPMRMCGGSKDAPVFVGKHA